GVFFFQADDGIRDRTVTGVQTCALPISTGLGFVTDILVYATESRADIARALLGAACQATGSSARLELYGSGSLYQRLGPRHGPRSEERRAGKEWRVRVGRRPRRERADAR